MEDERTTPDAPLEGRRSSFGGKLLGSLGGIGEAISRTAGAATTLLVDNDLRRRGVHIVKQGISHGIHTGATSIQRGIQSGIQTVSAGPRQIQSVLQRLSQQIEEQRMNFLLQQQQDSTVDVQVGFTLYEDAPQELRSRLWMALLDHPELGEEYQTCMRAVSMHGVSSAVVEEEEKAAQQNNNEDGEVTSAPPPSQLIHTNEPTTTATTTGSKPTTNPSQDVDGDSDTSTISKADSQQTTTINSNTSAAAQSIDKTQNPSSSSREKDEGWEVVLESQPRQGQILLKGASIHRSAPWNVNCEAFRNDLMAKMNEVPWPLPKEYSEESRYGTLLQISIGQEDIDEVIARDIHRTFPEYPMFALEQGQQALFRVLKAYSLHDMEVGYCQGMAFVAGLILFFVSEEPAFQIFCRLMSEKGPNLRRLYLPGLEGLKIELKKFEHLLEQHLLTLKNHLEAHGAVPVLFASQWFLTTFSCPFPVSFACRLVDVMLLNNNGDILLKTAVTIMADCEAELLMQEDFEELLTYLKVEPMNWTHHRLQRILNASINSPITDQDIEIAAAAARENHTLMGPQSAFVQQPSITTDGSGSGNIDAVTTTTTTTVEHETSITNTADGERPRRGRTSTTTSGTADAAAGGGGDVVEAELAKHRADLDDQYLALVLDLDTNWSGGGDVGGFEEALMATGSGGGVTGEGQGGDGGGTKKKSTTSD